MPELPEVEAVARRLRRLALGARILSAGFYRPAVTAPQPPDDILRATRGRTILAVQRRGKNILLHLDSGNALRVHLRMTGNLTVIPDHRLRPLTARLWFDLDDGRALILDDPRALGRVTLHSPNELQILFSSLGPEPLEAGFTPASFAARARASRKPIKLLLMDQQAVAGLGNIYAAEVLFQTRIHPARPASRISTQRLSALHTAIVDTLRLAIDSAVKAYEQPGRFAEGEDFPLAVYGREGEPCMRCGTHIHRIRQGGRSTYFCPGCQK